MSPLAAAVCLIMIICVLTKPLVALLLYGATSGYADGFGVSNFLGGSSSQFVLVMSALLLLLLGRAILKFLNEPSLRKQYPRALVPTAVAVIVTVELAQFSKGFSLENCVAELPYVGIPFLIIWLAFAPSAKHERLFRTFVFLQISLAALVILMPLLNPINGETYAYLLGIQDVGPGKSSGVTLPDSSTVKGAAARYGQFHNPNALGLYACFALACGFSSLAKHGGGRLLGITLIALGGFCWLSSLTRGPMLGILVAVVLLLTVPSRSERSRAGRRVFGIVAVFAVAYFLAQSKVVSYLVPSGNNISVTSRLDGYRAGLDAIGAGPLTGIGPDWIWGNDVPHFIGLIMGALYGVPVALGVLYLVFGTGATVVARALRADLGGDPGQRLAVLLVAVAWGIACTDNFAAPVLFWVAMAEAVMLTRAPAPDPSPPNAPAMRVTSSRLPNAERN